jgi:hypothetical protein
MTCDASTFALILVARAAPRPYFIGATLDQLLDGTLAEMTAEQPAAMTGATVVAIGWLLTKVRYAGKPLCAYIICGRPPPAKDVEIGFGKMVGCSHMSGPLVRCI